VTLKRRHVRWSTAAVVILAGLSGGVLGQSAAAVGRSAAGPDLPEEPRLQVQEVLPAVATVRQGESLDVQVRAANTGRATSAPARLSFFLSTDDVLSSDDVRIKGSKRVAAVRPGKTWQGTASVRLPAPSGTGGQSAPAPALADGHYRVIGCAANDCEASPTVGLGDGPPEYGSYEDKKAGNVCDNSSHNQALATCQQRVSDLVPVPGGIGTLAWALFSCPDPTYPYPEEGAGSGNPVWADGGGAGGVHIQGNIKAVSPTNNDQAAGNWLSYAGTSSTDPGYVTVVFTHPVYDWSAGKGNIRFWCSNTKSDPI
jgi:hypothetical protein